MLLYIKCIFIICFTVLTFVVFDFSVSLLSKPDTLLVLSGLLIQFTWLFVTVSLGWLYVKKHFRIKQSNVNEILKEKGII